MSTLLDALSDGSYDLQNKRDLSGDFSKKLLTYRDRIVSDYLKYKVNLSEAISKVAQRDSLNDDQIQRIIEEVNNQIYLIEYDKLKSSTTRDVEFDIASMQAVKKYMGGNDSDAENADDKKDDNKEVLKKSAFEKVKIDEWEKTASVNNDNAYADAPMYHYCDMSVENKVSRDSYMLRKIANTVKDKHDSLEKIASTANYKAYELGDAIINLERLGADTSNIVSSIVKVAGLTEKEFGVIKEAVTERTASLIEARYVPDTFSVNMDNVSVEKTASEKFSLGQFSKLASSTKCDSVVPKMELSTGKMIRGFDDISKLASEFKSTTEQLIKENDEYVAIREKCAGLGITNEMLEDIDFFQLSQVKK